MTNDQKFPSGIITGEFTHRQTEDYMLNRARIQDKLWFPEISGSNQIR
jgi:hypothetical protein